MNEWVSLWYGDSKSLSICSEMVQLDIYIYILDRYTFRFLRKIYTDLRCGWTDLLSYYHVQKFPFTHILASICCPINDFLKCNI